MNLEAVSNCQQPDTTFDSHNVLCFVVREQTTTTVNIEKKNERKLVYMRVCSTFFFIARLYCRNTSSPSTQQQYQNYCFCRRRYCEGCARIDNNRREYWIRKLRKDGVHVCVLRIFFSLRSFIRFVKKNSWHTKTNKIIMLAGANIILFFCLFFVFQLCENRQQPT